MKKLFYLSMLITFSFYLSCSKENVRAEYVGVYKLLKTSGGKTGEGTPVDWDKLKLEEDLSATFYFKDIKIKKADYSIILSDKCTQISFSLLDNDATLIELKSDPEAKCLKLDGNKMTWTADCCDRINYHLEKE